MPVATLPTYRCDKGVIRFWSKSRWYQAARVVVVVGFFFQILTVQKLPSFTVLKALGARPGSLAGSVLTQIAVMVGLGIVVGVTLLVGAVAGFSSTLTITTDPVLIATAGGAVLVSSLLAGLTSVRRIARKDPAAAAFGGGR